MASKRTRKLKLVYRKLSEISPYKRNPRVNDDAAVMVAKSIADYEYLQPIVITKDNVIVSGHTRVKALTILGYDELECIVADNLTPQQADEFRLVDNKVAQEAGWDIPLLNTLLTELEPKGFDMESFGFDIPDLEPVDLIVEPASSRDEAPEDDRPVFKGDLGGEEPRRVRCPCCGEWFFASEGEWE